MDGSRSLQEIYLPEGVCFGCGQANPEGLQIRSFVDGEHLVADWTPGPHHEAFPGILNGGIIGTLLDCQSNWTAMHALMERDGEFAEAVTAEYKIRLLRPTPSDQPLQLRSWPTEVSGRKVHVSATLTSNGEVCAESTGLFVRPKQPPGR